MSPDQREVGGFGVRFLYDDEARFAALAALCAEVSRDLESESFRDFREWSALVPDEVKVNFDWPPEEEHARWLDQTRSRPICVPDSRELLGGRWNFYGVFAAISDCDYNVLECVVVAECVAELLVHPHGCPFGGVGSLVALIEGFGFEVVGIND